VLNHPDDHDWLANIYREYWQRLYTAAYAILKDAQACEDIIQEIFLKLWQNRHRIEITTSLSAYLYASVRYEVYRQIKAGRVREDLFDDIYERIQAGPDYGRIEYKELHSRINAIVEQLPEKCKAVYKLSREEHLSHKEIAAQLDISTKTVENHLTKALSLLRLSLRQVITIGIITQLLEK
jgi:RNA polymerase sigma-70 factor (ECF subfamily)